jgi:mannitol/fructose-specific phosphotransferase system IIA component (Ntr-type)
MRDLFQFDAADVTLNISSSTRDGVLSELATLVSHRHPMLRKEDLLRLLIDRERLGSTGIGEGVAIPHCKSPALNTPVILFARSDSGIDFRAVDDRLVRLFFLLVTPEGETAVHLKLLARISRILKVPRLRDRLLAATGEDEIVGIVMEHGVSNDGNKPFN